MIPAAGRVADATGNWVDSLAPSYTRPYLRLARLDRPIGSWLLLMPCWWSVGLAGMHNDRFPSLWHILLFFIGALLGWWLETRHPRVAEEMTYPVASGWIAGESLMGVVLVMWENGPELLRRILGR